MPSPSYNDPLPAFIANLGGYQFDAAHDPANAACLFWKEQAVGLWWPDGSMIRLSFGANPRVAGAFTPILAGMGSLPPSASVPNTIPIATTIKQLVAMFWTLGANYAPDPVLKFYNEPNVVLVWPDLCEIRIALRPLSLTKGAITPVWSGMGSGVVPPAVIIKIHADRYILDSTPYIMPLPDFAPAVDYTCRLTKATFSASGYGPAPAGVTVVAIGRQDSNPADILSSATSMISLPVTANLLTPQPVYQRKTATGNGASGGMQLSGAASNAGASPALMMDFEFTVVSGGP
jgi:hypothetical protein